MWNARSDAHPTAARRWLRTGAPRLEVYVSSACLNCAEAVRRAEEGAVLYPGIVVQVVDLDLDRLPPPEPIVAVPTYVLDGQVVSLGNPYPEQLIARLCEAVG
jgi:alkyl hydroperoxide reductase subunit AhpF